jgi:seryl-tRNA synthetase
LLDIRKIREETDTVTAALAARGLDSSLDAILKLDQARRSLLSEVEAKRAQRKTVSDQVAGTMRRIGEARKAGTGSEPLEAEAAALKASSARLGDEIARLEEDLRPIDRELNGLMLRLPNIPGADVPLGAGAQDNQVLRVEGSEPTFDFQPKPHWDIAQSLGIIDFERAAKIASARFALYMGAGARLERALINFMLDTQTGANGYVEVLPPVLVNEDSMRGTGQLPKFADDLFRCADDPLWLIPTGEVPVTNIYRDEILAGERLPLKYAAYTPCFRREAGAHGRETRGLIRQHQFNKIELVKFASPESSYQELEALTADAEAILRRLGLHYRVISLCTGDLGFAAAKTYDLEVWLPSLGGFKEISSCSNFEDFQARRANIRFRTGGDRPRFVHTLNGSGLAVGRTVAAVLENYQRADGSVAVPEVLQGYMGVQTIPALDL